MANPNPSPAAPKVVTIKRFQIGINVLVQILVLFAIAVMLNYISFRHFKRWDFSRNQKYALSSQTKSILGSLPKPVRAVVFFSTASEIVPDVTALLREFEFASNKKFLVELVDPYRNLTRAQDLQTQYKFQANENIVILDYDGRNKFVNAADMADFEQPDQMAMMMGQTQPKLTAFKGEQAVTSALLELTENKPNKVYMLSGHGEPELMGPDFKVFAESLKRQNIQAASLNLLNAGSIPADTRAIIIAGPKYDLSELEMKLLADFWQKNGRVLVFLNPFARTPRLTTWLAAQGIAPQEDRIIRTGSFLSMGEGGAPQVKEGVVSNAGFNVTDSGTKITKDLVGLSKQLLGATQSLLLDQTKGKTDKIRLIPLLEAAPGYWGETDFATTEDRSPTMEEGKDHIAPLIIAAAAERGAVEDARVTVDTSRLVVAGNAEMLGNKGYQHSEGVTVDLSINALNWLLNREEQIGIAPKEKKNVTLVLTEKQIGDVALTVMLLVPGLAALFGLVNWWSRRS